MSFSDLLEKLYQKLPWPLITFLLILIILRNAIKNRYPETWDRYIAKLFRLIGLHRFTRQGAVEREVRSVINKGAKFTQHVTFDVPVLKSGIQIQWVSEGKGRSIGRGTKEGDVIVLLSYKRDEVETRLNALLAYLNEELLFETRKFLPKGFFATLVWYVAKFLTWKNDMAVFRKLDELIDSLYDQEKETFELLKPIYERGLLMPILIQELELMGSSLKGHIPPIKDFEVEVRRFAEFLKVVATKEKEEDVPLDFRGKYLKTGLILVSKSGVYRAHVDKAITKLKRGLKVYILALGKNIGDAEYVAKKLIEEGFMQIDDKSSFDLPPPYQTKFIAYQFFP